MAGREWMWLKQTGRKTPGGEASKEKKVERISHWSAFKEQLLFNSKFEIKCCCVWSSIGGNIWAICSGSSFHELNMLENWGHINFKNVSLQVTTRLRYNNGTLSIDDRSVLPLTGGGNMFSGVIFSGAIFFPNSFYLLIYLPTYLLIHFIRGTVVHNTKQTNDTDAKTKQIYVH